jgi:hypothetical protein
VAGGQSLVADVKGTPSVLFEFYHRGRLADRTDETDVTKGKVGMKNEE